MSLSSNGITGEVIRGVMPPYTLSTDLLEGLFRALAAPPPDATAAWRHARIARLVQEIGGRMPADAPQARIAAQSVIIREATDDTYSRSHAPGLTVEQVCRLRRTAADLTRSAATLERMLGRRQATPAPFFGTVAAAAVDIGALDAVWCKGIAAAAGAGVVQQGAAPEPVAAPSDPGPGINPAGPGPDGEAVPNHPAPPARVAAAAADPASDQPDGAALAVDAGVSAAVPPPSADKAVRARRARSAASAAELGPDAGATPAWAMTRLDQGPGWTLDVVRPRKDGEAGGGAAPTGS
jgi:hypothetical protein